MSARIVCGDVRKVAAKLEAESFDAVLCDPPYGLKFMGKTWDHGVPSADTWRDVFRVLKPGAMLLAFGGTRTHHRLMCAIEDAGFEIRDCLMFLHGQGFPKSLDIGKALDRQAGVKREPVGRKPGERYKYEFKSDFNPEQLHSRLGSGDAGALTAPVTDAARTWDGYGTALKPAWEPVILAMKPLDGTYAGNALKHGVAGLNIAAGRIGTDHRMNPPGEGGKANTYGRMDRIPGRFTKALGRWPANLLLSEEAARLLDEQTGDLKGPGNKNPTACGNGKNVVYNKGGMTMPASCFNFGDSGGASRFFYCAKASRKERGAGNHHPTVKPLKLTEYLAKLILPPLRDTPRRLLVPFCGSGSEMIGAINAGWDEVTGIELNPEYVKLARARLRPARQKAKAA